MTLNKRDVAKLGLLLLVGFPLYASEHDRHVDKPDLLQALNLVFVDIPEGQFEMGAKGGEYFHNPVYFFSRKVAAFKVLAYEVTWGQYKPCIQAGYCRAIDHNGLEDQQPVVNVNWQDTQDYIRWLNVSSNMNTRLPTEAEWEYAARAGSTTYYSWGDTIDCSKASYGEREGTCKKNDGPNTVGSYAPNHYGLYDMHGNVWEWTNDCWSNFYVSALSLNDLLTFNDCSHRVQKGGSWYASEHEFYSASRYRGHHEDHGVMAGFRLVQDAN